MKSIIFRNTRLIGLFCALFTFALNVAAQSSLAEKEKEFVSSSGDRMWYTMIFVVVASLAAAIFFWRRSQKGKHKPDMSYNNRYQNYYSSSSSDSVDAAMEMEWYRKAKKAPAQSEMTYGMGGAPGRRKKITATNSAGIDEATIDTKAFQEKMRKMQYTQLPINTFTELSPSKAYEHLPVVDDQALRDAIEQASEEYEEDEAVRELALRVLAVFKTKNSIESLSQIALYDLSANLRSKAVTALTDFDHESVFESILLACADPTREVRAAAARGLFRLNFDRADAWKRIIETGDEFRIRHSARAAVEAGIVTKAFERLVHEDQKVSYEAFVLVSMMIEAGETKEIFDAIRNHKDERVKFALLHVLKSARKEETLEALNELKGAENIPPDVMQRVTDSVASFEAVAA